jgi:hypothetical protein
MTIADQNTLKQYLKLNHMRLMGRGPLDLLEAWEKDRARFVAAPVLTGIDSALKQAAENFIKTNAIAAVGDIVETKWGDWKRPQKVRLYHVGAHLVCRYLESKKNWEAGFAMTYCAERLRKDGSSKEISEGSGICLSSFKTEHGKSWETGGKWNEELGFNHFGLSWGTNRDTFAEKGADSKMSPDGSLALWAKCPACKHCWPAAYYPIDLGEIGKALKGAACPKGCDAPPVLAKQDNGVLQEPQDAT